MKTLKLILTAMLLGSLTTFAQTTPPIKTRSDASFNQVDAYISVIKRLGIPTSSTDDLNATIASSNTAKLLFNTTLNRLRVYNSITGVWADATDLSNYYKKSEIDELFLPLSGGAVTGNLSVTGSVDVKNNVSSYNGTQTSYMSPFGFDAIDNSTNKLGRLGSSFVQFTKGDGAYHSLVPNGDAVGSTTTVFPLHGGILATDGEVLHKSGNEIKAGDLLMYQSKINFGNSFADNAFLGIKDYSFSGPALSLHNPNQIVLEAPQVNVLGNFYAHSLAGPGDKLVFTDQFGFLKRSTVDYLAKGEALAEIGENYIKNVGNSVPQNANIDITGQVSANKVVSTSVTVGEAYKHLDGVVNISGHYNGQFGQKPALAIYGGASYDANTPFVSIWSEDSIGGNYDLLNIRAVTDEIFKVKSSGKINIVQTPSTATSGFSILLRDDTSGEVKQISIADLKTILGI